MLHKLSGGLATGNTRSVVDDSVVAVAADDFFGVSFSPLAFAEALVVEFFSIFDFFSGFVLFGWLGFGAVVLTELRAGAAFDSGLLVAGVVVFGAAGFGGDGDGGDVLFNASNELCGDLFTSLASIADAFTTIGGSFVRMVNEKRRRQVIEPGKSTESNELSSIELSLKSKPSFLVVMPSIAAAFVLLSSLSLEPCLDRDGDVLCGVISMGADLPNLKSFNSLLLSVAGVVADFFNGVLLTPPIGTEMLWVKSR